MGAGGRAGLTILGQVGGSFFGPIGSAIGGMLGAALGNALWPEQIEGPKLGEFQMMTSTYGAFIPLIWGGMRVGGNVFWCSPIREVEVTEEVGKGGGAEQTTRRRYADIAVGLCQGEIIGIRKIWNNQKLVYDLGDSADIATIYASFSKGGEGMRFYSGSQTQLPDSLIEAVKGVGSTPAYRGLAYIVFENLELGTSFPNITAEVVRGGTVEGPRRLVGTLWALPSEAGTDVQARIASIGGEMIAIGEGEWAVTALDPGWHHTELYRSNTGRGAITATLDGDDVRQVALSVAPTWPPNQTNDSYGSLLLWPESAPAIYTDYLPLLNNSSERSKTFIGQAAPDHQGGISLVDAGYTEQLMDGGDNYLHATIPCADRRHVLALLGLPDTGTDPTYWVLFEFTSGGFVEVRRGTVDGFRPQRAPGSMSPYNLGGEIQYSCGMMESDLRHVWIQYTAGLGELQLCRIEDDGSLVLVEAFAAVSPSIVGRDSSSLYADNATCWVTAAAPRALYVFTRAPTLTIDLTLDELVADLCELAGLESSQIDVTALDEIEVNGYILKQRTTARAAIEPLMIAYGFDAVESDDRIKFVLRGATPAAEIPQDDLGAGQGQAAEALVSTTRTQEAELPIQLAVSYIAPHADYQVGTQTVTRGTTESNEKQQIQLPLALSDEEAIQIAYRMMYEMWTARNQRSFATTIKYSAYEPTDVLDLEVA